MVQPRLAVLLAILAAPLAAPLAAQKPDLYDLDTVRDIKLTFAQTNWWQLLEQNYTSDTNIEATLDVDGRVLPQVGVRFRGNTSYRSLPAGSQKKSINIETDWKVAGQKIYGYEHLNLNNGYHDPTFVREVIIYQIMRRYGMAPKANFVRLWLNNQYWGIYINVQQPNSDMMDEWSKTGAGNRYRGFPNGFSGSLDNCALIWLGTNVSSYQSAYQFKKGDGTDLINLCNVINNTPDASLQAALSKVYSIDQNFWYLTVMNVLMMTDCYIGTGKDHFLYHDEWHDLFHIFPFDVNEGLAAEGGTPTLSPWYNSTNLRRPALRQTLKFPDWRARYNAHYRTVVEESGNWAYIGGLVTKYQNMIAADVAADTKKIYPQAMFTANVTQDVVFQNRTIRGLKPSVEARSVYLAGQTELWGTKAALSELRHSPSQPGQNDTVWVTARVSGAAAVNLWSRSKGPFAAAPMYDDGQHGDGAASDGVWGAGIAPLPPGTEVEYYVEARTAAGVAAFLPRTAETKAPGYQVGWPQGTSVVKINEFLASNTKTKQDEKGQYDDWLELYNASNAVADASGMYLTDDAAVPTKYQIPANTFIPARGSILIWCDEDGTQGPLHANFKLSASGEDLLLFATDGKTQVDSFRFGPQYEDVSSGRLYDGLAPWVTFLAPTPEAVNLPACGHRSYSALDAATHPITLGGAGEPKIGGQMTWNLAKGPPQGVCVLLLAGLGGNVPLPALGFTLLVADPLLLTVALPFDAQGAATVQVPIPDDPKLIGVRLYGQAFSPKSGGWMASTAVETGFCPK